MQELGFLGCFLDDARRKSTEREMRVSWGILFFDIKRLSCFMVFSYLFYVVHFADVAHSYWML
jgi:hypothetical protein